MKRTYLALTVIALTFIIGCAPIKPPITSFNKYEIKNISLSKTDIVFTFNIENPNDLPLKIKNIVYVVNLDGSNVVTGTSEGFNMESKGRTTVDLPVEISYAKLMGQAMNLASKFITRNGSMKYAINGELTIADTFGFSANVPIKAEGEMKLF